MKNKWNRNITRLAAVFMSVMMIMSAAACAGNSGKSETQQAETGQNAVDDSENTQLGKDNQADNNEESADSASSTSDNKGDESASSESSENASDEIEGEWTFAYSVTKSEYEDSESYEYSAFADDEDSPDARLIIEKKDDKYIANYRYIQYESTLRIQGSELTYKNEPIFEGYDKSDWSYELSNAFDDEQEVRRITREGDFLVLGEEYRNSEDEEFYYRAVNRQYYLPKGSEKLKDLEDLRYFDKVEVDNSVDFINAIKNNTWIIMKPGEYSLSGIGEYQNNNPNIKIEYGELHVENVSNLRIEAPDGDVLISVTDPYSPVMNFSYGNHLVFDGITMGHDVEKGYCSGSVLSLSNSSQIMINNCHLYGCGTYGLELNSIYNMTVTDSEIYECTYGLLDMDYVGTINFKNCVFRDSEDMAMIDMQYGSGVSFEDCKFSNNTVNTSYEPYFVRISEEDDISFKNCSFNDNKYPEFSNYRVNMDGCTFDDSASIDGTIISETQVNGKEDILALYDKALQKQSNIDDKLKDENAVIDQTGLNTLAYEEYDIWDALLNKIWSYLTTTMSEEEMAPLTEEQRKWIAEKEASVKEAGAPWEGGSMQPMVTNGTAADITRQRVEYLLDKFIR